MKKQLIENMKIAINKVINGEQKSVSLDGIYPNDVKEYIEELGGEDLQEFDSNGWQWDFWMYFLYNGQRYMLAGSGYFGDLTFNIK